MVPVSPHWGENVPGFVFASRTGSIDMSAPITPLTAWYLNRPASVPASIGKPRDVQIETSPAAVGTGIDSPLGWLTAARASRAKNVTPNNDEQAQTMKAKCLVKLMPTTVAAFRTPGKPDFSSQNRGLPV